MTGTPSAGPPLGEHAARPGDDLVAIERHLDDVEAALERLDDGSYGICRSCGGPIPDDRLAADPTALLCDRCRPAPAGPQGLGDP